MSLRVVLLIIIAEVASSLVLAHCLPLPKDERFVLVGTVAQLLGVALVTVPDVENSARALGAEARHWLKKALSAMRAWLSRTWGYVKTRREDLGNALQNMVRRMFGRPRREIIRAADTLTVTVVESASATGAKNITGSLEERLANVQDRLTRLEAEIARMPSRWRGDMVNLRDARVALRWIGVPLILVGVVLVAIPTW